MMAEFGLLLRHAWHGERQAALETITERLEQAAWWDDLYALWVAEASALVGELDRAVSWLDHAIDYGIANVRFLSEHDPFLASLRSHDRFASLMEKAKRVSETITK